jgi:hypothetical protein
LVEHTGRSEAEYVSYLEKIIRDRHLVASGTSTDWSNESHDLARAAWLSESGLVDEKYYERQVSVVDERLALAGLRLAAVLNGAFSR